jgi:hypothetical protein
MMIYRTFLIGAGCVVASMVTTPALATLLFSEDFETYVHGNELNAGGGANVNGWTPWTTRLRYNGAFGLKTPMPVRAVRVENVIALNDLTTFPFVSGASSGTSASATPVVVPLSGITTLDLDFNLMTADGRSGGATGITFKDTMTGKYVNWLYTAAASGLEATDAAIVWFADAGTYQTGQQHLTLSMNFNTDTFTATVSSSEVTYGGNPSSTSSTLALPLGFDPDRLILWNAGLDENPTLIFGPRLDNLSMNVSGTTLIPGDTDFDGDVDLSDLGNMATYYGAEGNATWPRGDFDDDQDVDLNDLSALAANYGAGQAQAFADFSALTSIPEPATPMLLCIAALGLFARRARAQTMTKPFFISSATALALVMSLGWTASSQAEVGDLSRGHVILLERGLQIDACAFPGYNGMFDAARWAESNYTTIDFADRNSFPTNIPAMPEMPWSRVLAGRVDLEPNEFARASSLVRLQFSDEQDIADASHLEEAKYYFDEIRLRYPNVIMHTNQWGTQHTPAQLRNYMEFTQPDMLMFDTYPFNGAVTGGSPTALYQDLAKYRMLGLEGNDGSGNQPIPVGLYTQNFVVGGHTVSESEIRLNNYASWVFGNKVVTSFIYDSWPEPGLDTIMFNGAGTNNPTPSFYHVAETNRQSRQLGPALVRLLSSDLRIVRGQHGIGQTNALPSGVAEWNDAADPYISSIVASNLGSKNNGLKGDVLVGYFEPLDEVFADDGFADDIYFMIVNGLSDAAGTAAQTRQSVRLDFNFGGSGIDSLLRVSTVSGLVEEVSLTHDGGSLYHLDLQLDGGTGQLFKFNNGASFLGSLPGMASFATLSIPEPSAAILLIGVSISLLCGRHRPRESKPKPDAALHFYSGFRL